LSDVALVCGAGGALGSAVVGAFLARGDRVIGVDRTGAPREGVQMEAADLTDPDAVEALWERIDTPRWVVNAAGGFRTGTLAESEPADVRFLLQLNLETAWWSCRAAARRLPRGGGIVNVAARAGLTGGAGSAAYAVSKAAVIRLTQVLALELAEREVRVNVIVPALIDTPANRAHGITGGTPPAEIAATVAFLLSDAAHAVTGAIVPV
jgi:NAD(P)-dependent dehydrogenase (short-subunit alcohol dehydrogenase family)